MSLERALPYLRCAGVLCLAIGLFGSVRAASADTPLGGLAVATDAAGTRLFAAGDNRTLYELDPTTLEVKRRHWLGTTVVRLVLTPDGKSLIAEDTSGVVRWLDTATFNETKRIEHVRGTAPSPAAGLIVGISTKNRGTVRVFLLASGTERATLEATGIRGSIAGVAVSADGRKVAAWSQGFKGPEERKRASEMPAELKGLARREWREKHDGRSSTLVVLDMRTKEPSAKHELWFSPGGSTLVFFRGPSVHAVCYDNNNAVVDSNGAVSLYAIGSGYNYGANVSADGNRILAGGLRNGHVRDLGEPEGVVFKLDSIDGWPEYFESFTIDTSGAGFAGTSAYRVVKIDAKGRIVKVAPVF